LVGLTIDDCKFLTACNDDELQFKITFGPSIKGLLKPEHKRVANVMPNCYAINIKKT
jgi:hypothetical protein